MLQGVRGMARDTAMEAVADIRPDNKAAIIVVTIAVGIKVVTIVPDTGAEIIEATIAADTGAEIIVADIEVGITVDVIAGITGIATVATAVLFSATADIMDTRIPTTRTTPTTILPRW